MKIIKDIANRIEEELHDAETYAKLATIYRPDHPEASDTFLTISRQELSHANMLHAQAERMIKEYRERGNTVPPAMQAVYDWEHEKMIDNMARIKTMQDMIR